MAQVHCTLTSLSVLGGRGLFDFSITTITHNSREIVIERACAWTVGSERDMRPYKRLSFSKFRFNDASDSTVYFIFKSSKASERVSNLRFVMRVLK